MADVDQEILERIEIEADQDRDALAEEVLADARALLDNLNASESESAGTVEALFKAVDFAPPDPFTPPENIPSYDAGTYNQLKEMTTGQARALDIGLQVAKNYQTTEKIEGVYTDAAFIQAQTRTKQQQIVNEGYRLNQAIEVGNLINAKTEGLQLQTSMQKQQNLTAAKLVEIEGEKGRALIEGALIQVDQIRTTNNSLLIEHQRDFDSLRGAGLNGSYNPIQ